MRFVRQQTMHNVYDVQLSTLAVQSESADIYRVNKRAKTEWHPFNTQCITHQTISLNSINTRAREFEFTSTMTTTNRQNNDG